jgi:glycosyltransferase involved in cell wall biosynthesis
MNRHVVLVGMNYQMRRCTGDKNFWFELIPLIAGNVDRITVISLRRHVARVEAREIDGCEVVVHYLPPVFLETPDAEDSAFKIFWRGGAFPTWLGIIEKALNIRLSRKLREIYEEEPFSHVHLMDNFGFGNRGIVNTASSLNCTVSISAMAHQGRNSLLYYPYLRLSFKHPGLCVVPYSEAHRYKLIEIGLNPDKVVHIPWGVIPRGECVTAEEKSFAKTELGINAERTLFLWAGYIQQIQRNDFLYALRCARRALEEGLNATFYFAFKPETMEKRFLSYHNPSAGIHVTSTDVENFDLLKRSADIFYSPVTNARCIITPPLTWIEMLSQGVPLLTTEVPGVDAVVEEGKTGYIGIDERDLMEKMHAIGTEVSVMQSECIKKVECSYNLHHISSKYLDLWFNPERSSL